MKFIFLYLSVISIISMMTNVESSIKQKFEVVVHGGAGSYNRSFINKEKEVEIKKGILEALKAGYEVLKNATLENDPLNPPHLDAVEKTAVKLEDNPLFNAGKGGKLNSKMEVELDASIMDGRNKNCGGVAASKHIKNPIKGARMVMEKTEHILLVGEEVDTFAKGKGLEIERNDYFLTPDRVKEFLGAKEEVDKLKLSKSGTIGVVVRDHFGNLAAGTSTGGITYKLPGRVGDSPIIGAGNYANNESVAVSCTGTGEIMMKNVIAFDVHARMTYKNIPLKESLDEIFANIPENTGGIIAVDKNGQIEMPFNSGGMARGYVREDGIAYVYIFNEGEDTTPTVYDFNSAELKFLFE
jgi:beta-aspartyl-peptidase (threonine type)